MLTRRELEHGRQQHNEPKYNRDHRQQAHENVEAVKAGQDEEQPRELRR